MSSNVVDIQIHKKFKCDGKDWPPECDTAPNGFRVGNIYLVPANLAQKFIDIGWAAKPGEEPRNVGTSEANLQPNDVAVPTGTRPR